MYQLRLKALARDAGVGAIVAKNGRLVLQAGGTEYRNRKRLQRVLDGRAVMGRREIHLPQVRDWREELVAVLKEMARVVGA